MEVPADLPQDQLIMAIRQAMHGEPDPDVMEYDHEDVEETTSIPSDMDETSEEEACPPKRTRLTEAVVPESCPQT